MSTADPVLDIAGLSVHYGLGRKRHRALNDVSLRVSPGETVGIIGETGSGKSTLARAVLGLTPTSDGTITVAGEDVTSFNQRRWRDQRRSGLVQYVFQDPLRSLDPDLTVRESLTEPLLLRGSSRRDAETRAVDVLGRVDLHEELLNRLPGELSGGQRQRVAVARALVPSPSLLILDEPVSALDSANRVRVLEILKGLRDSGVALVFISHDLGSVAGVANRIAVLYKGQLVEVGPVREVITTPRHPYTRLLVRSAPTLNATPADRAERDSLRALLTPGSAYLTPTA